MLYWIYDIIYCDDNLSTLEEKEKKKIQRHKRFKITLIYYGTDNTMQIFREIPCFRPQHDI